MRIGETATYLRPVYLNQAGEGADLGGAAQDVESRIAEALFSKDDDATHTDDTAANDGRDLSDADDVENGDDADVDDTDSEDDSDDEEDDTEGDQTLASILGVDEDKLEYDDEGNVVFNAVIDGKSQKVSMGELVKSYQLEGHVNNKSIALENDRKEFEQTRDKAYVELANRLNSAGNLVKAAEESLMTEFQSIDWDQLRYSDPAEWAAQRQLFQERYSKIEQAKNTVQQGNEALTAEQQQQQQQKQQQFIEGEVSKMIAANPSWNDHEVMAKEVGEIGKFLQDEFGFTPEEVANSMDARLMKLIQMAHKAHKGDKGIKDKKVSKKVPKFRKPNQSRNNESLVKAREAKAKKAAVRKSGGSADAIAASIIDRM